MATGKRGYDYEFVDPPKSLECPLCLLTLRDPHMISCCGYEFCESCIQRVKRDGKPCPLCNEPSFSTLLNKKLVREINALVVRCPQKDQGCDWKGELGQVQQHLNPAGAELTFSKGCGYVIVECTYQCGAQLQRRMAREHEMDTCPKRPIEMQVVSLVKEFETILVENQLLKQELDRIKDIHEQEMIEMKRTHKDQWEKLKQELSEMKKERDQKMYELQQMYKQDLNEIKQQLNKMKPISEMQQQELSKVEKELSEMNKMNSHLQKAYKDVQESCDWLKRRLESMTLSLKANNINA